MNIWIVTIGEPLPIDNNKPRLMRSFLLAEELSKKDSNVLFWTSTFNHTTKKFRYKNDFILNHSNNLKIHLLHGCGYLKNISLRRIIDHWIISKKFSIQAIKGQKPDLIICSFPTIGLSHEAIKFGKKNRVPVIIDIRDMWPEIYLDIIPMGFIRKIVKSIFLLPIYKRVESVFKNSTSIMGITNEYVDWALKMGKREATNYDIAIPFGYKVGGYEKRFFESAQFKFSKSKFITNESFNICLISHLGPTISFDEILITAKYFKDKLPINFIFCGTGDKEQEFKIKSKDCHNINFLGHLEKPELEYIMSISHVAILPYKSKQDFIISIPNKFVEYISSSLPIISCLRGCVENEILKYKCGYVYYENNPESLISMILTAFNDRKNLAVLSKNAKELFETKYSFDLVYKQMTNHIFKIINYE
jgi:glycosyltransferase involved in cell wall biosynthesis